MMTLARSNPKNTSDTMTLTRKLVVLNLASILGVYGTSHHPLLPSFWSNSVDTVSLVVVYCSNYRVVPKEPWLSLTSGKADQHGESRVRFFEGFYLQVINSKSTQQERSCVSFPILFYMQGFF
jgi:hypothetical protein